MGKKNDTATPVTESAGMLAPTPQPPEPAKPKPASPSPIVQDWSPARSPAKPPAKKKPAKKAARVKLPPLTTEEIGLRAYFISENRHRDGIGGDAHSDWIAAERQLKAERRAARRKMTAKKAPARRIKA
jgi:hypothetical protein